MKARFYYSLYNRMNNISCYNPPPLNTNAQSDMHGPSHLWYKDNILWQNGSTLKIYFMDTTDENRNKKVLSIAKEWENYVNLKLKRTHTQEESDIRISYLKDEGSYSYEGKICLNQLKTSQTMNFGWFQSSTNPNEEEFRCTTLHEFGHALGFSHELQHPAFQIPWDEQKVFAYYTGPPNYWPREKVARQVLHRLPSATRIMTGSDFDPDSIMCYYINKSLLQEKYVDQVPTNVRNSTLSQKDKKKARMAYPLPLKNFPLGCKVKTKEKNQVLQEFSIVGRDDYCEWMDRCNGQEGRVIALHPTNGVKVEFTFGYKVWYEPECLIKISHINMFHPQDIQRLYIDTKVKVLTSSFNFENKIGTVKLNFESDDNISIKFADHVVYQGNPQEIEIQQFYFDNQLLEFSELELTNFPIGSQVEIKPKGKVMKVFEYANRDDYFASYMDKYCGQQGLVDLVHPTNGIRVKFEDEHCIWYEPGCLNMLCKGPGYVDMPRLLRNTIVEIKEKQSKYYGRKGSIKLHFKNDYSKVTVVIGGFGEEYVAYNMVQCTNSFF